MKVQIPRLMGFKVGIFQISPIGFTVPLDKFRDAPARRKLDH